MGCWLAERRSSSGPGCAMSARSDPMGTSSLNNGSCTLPHRECQPTLADDSTWSSPAPRRGEARCDPRVSIRADAASTAGSYAAEDFKSWNGEAAGRFVHHFLRVRSQKAPLALRRAADAGYREHGTGGWPVPLRPCQRDEPPLERVLKLAVPAPNPICLPVSLPPGTGGKIFCRSSCNLGQSSGINVLTNRHVSIKLWLQQFGATATPIVLRSHTFPLMQQLGYCAMCYDAHFGPS